MMEDVQLVRLAVKRGFVTEDQLAEARQQATDLANRGIDRNLCFILQDLGHLSAENLNALRNETSSARISALEVDGYLVRERIGKGGMGDVFLAVHPRTGDEVAAKLLPVNMLGDDEFLRRFEREVRVLRGLQHPHITGYRSAGDVEGRPFLLMEHVRGESLKQRIFEHGNLDESEVVILLTQMADALDYAFKSTGVLHRDVKPANIILGDAEPGSNQPFMAKLCDFGLAKTGLAPGSDETGTLTKTGMAVGTPHYMSPEIATCDGTIDVRADIYSLGATAYFALCGKTLYHGKNSGVIMYKHATNRITIDDVSAPGASRHLRSLLVDMLARDRNERLQDWSSVKQRLQAMTSGDASAEESTNTLTAHQERQRQVGFGIIMLVAGIFAVVVAALALIIGESGTVITSTPEEFSAKWVLVEERLRENPDADPVIFELAPGTYTFQWKITPSHNGLQVRGSTNGVILQSPSQQPLVQVDSFVQDVEFARLRMMATGDALVMKDDSSLEFHAVHCESRQTAVTVQGGKLMVHGSHIKSLGDGVVVEGGQFTSQDTSLVAAGTALRGVDAQAELRSTWVQSTGRSAAVIDWRGGGLVLTGVHCVADGSAVGLELAGLEKCMLQDVHVQGAGIAMRCYEMPQIHGEGLSLEATRIGLDWTGTWTTASQWNQVKIQAEQALRGSSVHGLPSDGNGANLDQYPTLPRLALNKNAHE